jgi:predicted  nucleic acid-binding Zn-ribbon protein
MSGPAVIFREIHRLRRFAHDLQEQLDRMPRQLKAQQAKVARQEEQLRDAQETIKRLKVAVQKKEGEIKDLAGKIKRYEQQLNEIMSKKEFDALQVEISHARGECQRFEDEALASMEEGEQCMAQLPEVEKGVKQAREELAKFEGEAAGRKTSLTAQLSETLAKLKEVEAEVPADLRPQYNRMVGSKGADALAAVRGQTCSACYTEITAQALHDLQQEMYVTCKSCGRILYLPEGAAPAAAEDE